MGLKIFQSLILDERYRKLQITMHWCIIEIFDLILGSSRTIFEIFCGASLIFLG